jgi:hypothetical protein
MIAYLEGFAEDEIARRRETVFRIVETLTVIEPTRPVIARAAQPLPVVLGTLDAIHLATSLLRRECSDADLIMATHDEVLGLAARALGFRVIGL